MESKFFLSFASLVCVAANMMAQTAVTEDQNGVTSIHALHLNALNVANGSSKYYILCTDENKSYAQDVYKVDENGNVMAPKVTVYSGEGIGATNQSFLKVGETTEGAANDGFTVESNGYGGTKPLTVSASTLWVNADMDVKGKITCRDQFKVMEMEANNIKANDITVDMNNAADYVFDESYILKSLREVESYVKENKHLPGIPSAEEMEEKGMSVSVMSNLLLEKVEELTLHLIRLEKENSELKAKIESLEK